MLSTPLLEAPSISTRSRKRPSLTARQCAQVLSGRWAGSAARQFRALATRRAVVVFPQPRGPENKYAWAIWSLPKACRSVWITGSWPTTSSHNWGRHVRYRAWAGIVTFATRKTASFEECNRRASFTQDLRGLTCYNHGQKRFQPGRQRLGHIERRLLWEASAHPSC